MNENGKRERDVEISEKQSQTRLGKQVYQCEYCSKICAFKSRLVEHIRTHTKEKPFRCKVCFHTFALKSNLTAHERIHTNEKPFTCRICAKTFRYNATLTKHLRCHTGNKPFECNVCNQTFRQTAHYNSHLLIHSGEKPFKCNVCNKTFRTSGTCKRHMLIHSGEIPFKCNICNKTFRDRENFKNHAANHSDDRAYKCDMCEKSFATKQLSRHHVKTHSNDRVYKCDHCCNTYKRSSDRTRHHKNHEEQKKYANLCLMQDGGSKIAQSDDIQCTVRCKTQRDLEYHIQRHHTDAGIAAKFKSEQQLADFFTKQNISFDRDWLNFISFKPCSGIEGSRSSARPDFYLHTKSAELECVLLVCNDEFAHRQTKCEFQRIFNIAHALQQTEEFKDIPIVFVRFNPHFFHIDEKFFDIKLEMAHIQLLQTINSLQKTQIKQGVNLVFVNYDKTQNRLDIFEDAENDDYAKLYQDCVILC